MNVKTMKALGTMKARRKHTVHMTAAELSLLREVCVHRKQSEHEVIAEAVRAVANNIWPFFCESCEKRSEHGKGWSTDNDGVWVCPTCAKALKADVEGHRPRAVLG